MQRDSDLEQIKFLLGHPSIQTTDGIQERSRTSSLPRNDNLGLEK